MGPSASDIACRCSCGATHFTIQGPPLVRAYCHCHICQEFNNAPYADITIYRGKHLTLPDDSPVDYKVYRQPPLVHRGRCRECGKPALEFIRAPLFPELVLVPHANFTDPAAEPEPALHMFYHRRVADADDDLPKYSGYLGSQLGSMRHIIGAMLRG